jgi:hypothetical protein
VPWYRLAGSGVPWHTEGDAPPGATPVDGPDSGLVATPAADAAGGTVLLPFDGPYGAFLDQPIPVVVEHLDAATVDLDVVERLLVEEHAGAARKGLLDQLERMRDRLDGDDG